MFRLIQDRENEPHFSKTRLHLVDSLEHLFFQGDRLEAIYIVKSGSLKSYVINPAGDEQIINFHFPGDVLALDALSNKKLDFSMMALQTSSVCVVPIGYLEHAISEIIPDWMMQFVFKKLKQEQSSHVLLGKKTAKTRIAAFLLEISENYKTLGYSGSELKLNMSRQDIGNYLGLAPETISRAFTWMQDKGLLELDRRELKIVDYDDLSRLAEKQESANYR
jgi:CRP/FNR family transcriptional regulator